MKANTKHVTIHLAAMTRVTYTEVMEVPADTTDDDLDELVKRRYEVVDGGKFTSDPDYWERGTCYHESAEDAMKPTLRLTAGGEITSIDESDAS